MDPTLNPSSKSHLNHGSNQNMVGEIALGITTTLLLLLCFIGAYWRCTKRKSETHVQLDQEDSNVSPHETEIQSIIDEVSQEPMND